MADKLQLLLEAEKRGILPDDKKALLDEARKRGLIPGGAALPAQAQPTPDMPAPNPGLGDTLSRQLGLTGRYVTEGLTALPTMVGDAANSTVNLGIRGVNEMTGTDIPYLMKPTQAVQGMLDAAGAPKPETMTERIVSYPSRMLAGTGTTKAIGDLAAKAPGAVSGLADLARGLPQQAGGAVGAGAAQGVTAEVTDNPVAQFLAALAGGMAGGKLTDMAIAPKPAAIPSTQEIKGQASALFKQAEATDAILSPAPLNRLAQQVQQDATDFGYLPSLQPRVASVLQELERVSKGNISIKGMMTLRKVAQNAANSTDDAERALGGIIIGRIDDAMASLGADDVLQGNADEAAAAWSQARELWGQYKKSQTIEKALEKADRAAQSSGTGGNTDNALRQKINAILNNDKAKRGFTQDEIAQMKAIVKGAPLTNVARLAGRFSPTAGFLPAALSTGAAGLFGTPGMALPILGLAGKGYADRATRAGIENLLGLIRTGGSFAPPPVNQGIPDSLLGLIPATSQASGLFAPVPQSPARPLPARRE